MKQAAIGIPDPALITRRAQGAYRWLLAQLEKNGTQVLSHAEAQRAGAPRFDLQAADNGDGFSADGNPDDYRIEIQPGRLILNARGKGIRAGLGEITSHILRQAHHPDTDVHSAVSSVSRCRHWALRCSPENWEMENFQARLDFLASLGFDTICLDGFQFSSSLNLLRDEQQAGGWEVQAQSLLNRLEQDGWFTVLVLPVQLDMGMPRGGQARPSWTPPCRMIPEQRRRMLHRFEAILSSLHSFDAIGIAVNDWPRCDCPVCEKSSFEEEAAYYLRAFTAVMKRHAPGCECWILPDGASWNLLQEIRTEFPDAVKVLVPFIQDPDEPAEFEGHQPEAGLQIDLSHPGKLEWLDPLAFETLRLDWDQEGPPGLLLVSLGEVERFPLQLLSLLRLLWEREDEGSSFEDFLFRLSLPLDQWWELPAWKSINQEIGQAIHKGSGADSSLQSIFSDLPALHQVEASFDGKQPSVSLNGQRQAFLPDLYESLLCSLQRLQMDHILDPIIHQILSLPEGRPLESRDYKDTVGLVIALSDFLSHPLLENCYEKHEQRVLENLRDSLSLLVSEIRNRRVWDHGAVPDLDQWLGNPEEK